VALYTLFLAETYEYLNSRHHTKVDETPRGRVPVHLPEVPVHLPKVLTSGVVRICCVFVACLWMFVDVCCVFVDVCCVFVACFLMFLDVYGCLWMFVVVCGGLLSCVETNAIPCASSDVAAQADRCEDMFSVSCFMFSCLFIPNHVCRCLHVWSQVIFSLNVDMFGILSCFHVFF